jgi:hypothetical protein
MDTERRQKHRINSPIQVIVRGSDSHGALYRFDAITRDIGSDGLCAMAPRVMKEGERISLRIRFAKPGSKTGQAPAVTARAVVLRVEEQPNDSSLFAVSFLSRRMV